MVDILQAYGQELKVPNLDLAANLAYVKEFLDAKINDFCIAGTKVTSVLFTYTSMCTQYVKESFYYVCCITTMFWAYILDNTSTFRCVLPQIAKLSYILLYVITLFFTHKLDISLFLYHFSIKYDKKVYKYIVILILILILTLTTLLISIIVTDILNIVFMESYPRTTLNEQNSQMPRQGLDPGNNGGGPGNNGGGPGGSIGPLADPQRSIDDPGVVALMTTLNNQRLHLEFVMPAEDYQPGKHNVYQDKYWTKPAVRLSLKEKEILYSLLRDNPNYRSRPEPLTVGGGQTFLRSVVFYQNDVHKVTSSPRLINDLTNSINRERNADRLI